MISLQDLRNQIDHIDQLIIEAFSQWREKADYLDILTELTPEDKERLRSTWLHFSQRVCELLQKRMQISADIGHVKYSQWRITMIDKERKQIMIQSRVEWAPEKLKSQVREFYRRVHDISVRIQREFVS